VVRDDAHRIIAVPIALPPSVAPLLVGRHISLVRSPHILPPLSPPTLLPLRV
jgi:hypothetical protein